jgi:hypothetical protein
MLENLGKQYHVLAEQRTFFWVLFTKGKKVVQL